MIMDEQLRQIAPSEDFDPMAALLGMNVSVRRELYQERARINEMVVGQHTEDIESLKRRLMRRTKKSMSYVNQWTVWWSRIKS